MRLLEWALFLALAMGAGTAGACGPTRYKEITTIEINAPLDKVWAIVGNYGDMSWNPAVSKTEATGGTQPDVDKRTLTFTTGKRWTDVLSVRDQAAKTIAFMSIDEDTSTMPVRGYNSKITIKADGRKSVVEWRGTFTRGYPNSDPPPELNDEAAAKAVSAFQQAALASLKSKLEGGS